MFHLKHFLAVLLLCTLINKSYLKYRNNTCDFHFAPKFLDEELLYHEVQDLTYYHIWNQTSMSVMDYHREVCPDRCDNGTKVHGRDRHLFLNIECFNCKCKRPACEMYGICCEDISESPSTWTQPKESPSLYCDDKSMYNFPFLCIRSCPKDYRGNNEVKRLCQEDVSVSETTMDTFLRVIDTENEGIYYNIYCAMCNNVNK
ncbi:G-protein coupled receptor, putative, partial [Biomphalaria glabrata]